MLDPVAIPARSDGSSPSLQLEVIYDRSINYALQQNAIPVVSELRVRNQGIPRHELTIRIFSEPAFATALELRIQSLGTGEEVRFSPVELKLSPAFLEGLNEKVAGVLKIEVVEAGMVLCRRAEPISLFARNEWCGLASLPEILAAFVLPNDPAVMSILDRAAEILRAQTVGAQLNGYLDKNRKRAWEQIAAIYKAVSELNVRYISPAASFEKTGQKVRFPSDIRTQRFGTCLDLALLVAACCEQAGLHPLVFIHQGHAYAGCWLEERTLPEPTGDDLQQIRKLEADHLITVFECTLLANEFPGTLPQAELAARVHLQTELPFLLALDVKGARSARILPLPILGSAQAVVDESPSPMGPAVGMGSREFASPLKSPSEDPPKPVTRIDLWKSRLLDLTLRNRFLNFKETNATIRLLSASPAKLEDELAAERELSLRPKPKVMGGSDPRNPHAYTQQQREDALAEHLREELTAGRLHTNLEESEHPRRLTELFRAAREALDENGANTLFAAVGFLEWREAEHSDRILRAPLLLVPVQLKRKSVLEGFALRRIDEETRLNVTLMEMLHQHFHKEIPGLDPLPEDESGVDVERVFQLFREAVRDLPGWEVKSEIWLGQFSFTKFLLWKDLHDRLDALVGNRVVHHLVYEAGAQYPNPLDDITPAELDDQFRPGDIFCPRSADSSQLAAIAAAAAGHDFVLEGPPGTGKSQTITNIIAHCLAQGKRVLFVAEKRTALEVVHRRLREDGLDPFCLELHSNKTGKSEVLAQFDRSLKFLFSKGEEAWQQRSAELDQLRASLNGYPRALHERHACGLSAYECLDYLIPRQREPTVRFPDWLMLLETSAETLERARELTRRLQERSRPVVPLVNHPLGPLSSVDWSPAWSERVIDQIREIGVTSQAAAEAARDFFGWLHRPSASASQEEFAHLVALADSLLAPHRVPAPFVTAQWNVLAPLLDTWIALLVERDGLRKKLIGYREKEFLALHLVSLQARWDAAQSSGFLIKWIRIRGVRLQLRTPRTDHALPLATAIPEVLRWGRRLQEINQALLTAAPTAELHLGELWAKGEPAPEELSLIRKWGQELHLRMAACAARDLGWLDQIRREVAVVCAASPRFTGVQGAGDRLTRFRATQVRFNQSFDAFVADVRLRREAVDAAPDYLGSVRALAEGVSTAWPKIREWCSWQKARHDAVAMGLGPVIASLESEEGQTMDLPHLFERSFRRALLFAALEKSAALREFFGQEQDERIARFSQVDDKLAALAADVIRARLAAKIPRDTVSDDLPKAEIGLLRREIAKKIRHLPVRRLLASIPHLFRRLKPCVLMSPLSVAQYLEATRDTFDLVIFDEASQIPVWDAVGAIARGKQLIVVGDPKQLPPTNFFTSNSGDDIDLASEEQRDLESILDELLSNGLRHKRLRWHYRSRHEGLIAFSNRHYYADDLLTFPSAAAGVQGVSFRYLPAARYDKGRSRTNRLEAEALVAELVARLRKKDGPVRSYGVVTFSLPQQQLVENLLDEERRKYPEIELHFGDSPPVEGEPVIVKNLENVQGEERDVVIFSICYGPDGTGQPPSMNLGALSREGGGRRLNVAVTRAKHELLVFSSMRSDQIDLSRTRALGVRDLKWFLDYAERGPKALTITTGGDVPVESASEFEALVAARLREEGYEVHLRVGCSGYRIDLGVVDPSAPGRYLLGVECDGPTYRRAATARDRDKLRTLILRGLGWELHRIWSTDWWHNPEAEMKKLLAAIAGASKTTRIG